MKENQIQNYEMISFFFFKYFQFVESQFLLWKLYCVVAMRISLANIIISDIR